MNTDTIELTREQEVCLKKELLKLAVENEIQLYMRDTSQLDNTIFLRFLKNFVMTFPLLDLHEKAREKLNELFLRDLPYLLGLTQKATKHDIQDRKLRVAVVSFFHLVLHTEKERAHYRRFHDESFNVEEELNSEVSDDPIEQMRKKNRLQIGHVLSKICLSIFVDLEEASGVHRLFTLVRNADIVDQLPNKYKLFVENWGKLISVAYEKRYSDQKRVSVLKRLYTVTPVTAIKAVLSMTEPVKILQALIHLCLARPMGTHNLLQKWAGAATEIKRTRKLLDEAQRKMAKELDWVKGREVRQMQRFLQTYAETNPLQPEEEASSFRDTAAGTAEYQYELLLPFETVINVIKSASVFSPAEIARLTKADVASIREVLLLEMRLVEKNEFIEVLGSPKVLETIRELVPIFYGPFSALFCKNDIVKHFENYIFTTKKLVQVSQQAKELPIEQRFAVYEEYSKLETQALYTFMHGAAQNDSGQIEQSLQWYVNFLQFVHRKDALNMQGLVMELSPEKRTALLQELDSINSYWKQAAAGEPPAVKPTATIAKELLPAFIAYMLPRMQDDLSVCTSHTPAAHCETTGAGCDVLHQGIPSL